MRSIISFCFLILMCIAVNAQRLSENDVPKVVIKKFKKEFSSADNVVWGRENITSKYFGVLFSVNGAKHSIQYDLNGNKIASEIEQNYKDISPIIKNSLSQKFGTDFSVENIKKVKSVSVNDIYEVFLLNRNNEGIIALINHEGTIDVKSINGDIVVK